MRSTCVNRVRNQLDKHLIHPTNIFNALTADPPDHDTLKKYIGFDSDTEQYKFSGPFLCGPDAVAGQVRLELLFTNKYLPKVSRICTV
jgi:hypothetical protein